MLGVIGCGNMAGAVVRGIFRQYPYQKFKTYTPSKTRALSLAKDVNGEMVSDLSGLEDCETILIACKPQQFPDLVTQLKGNLSLKNKYVISIMAAVSIETLQKKLKTKTVTRVMPNTPSLFGQGVSLVFHSSEVSNELQDQCAAYFNACSQVYPLKNEEMFDRITTVTGSGPAYIFYFAQVLQTEVYKWGVDEGVSRQMIAQLFKGAASLLEQNTDRPWEELISEVTSKGGVTIEALKVLQENQFSYLVQKALAAAVQRSDEMTRADS